MSKLIKTAAGDVAETQLEQTFSDLSNARLRDKSPALVDYLIGFQMVKSNDDGSKAVGLFGFEIGDSVYYTPVFFLSGDVKGLDSIYGPDADLFVPLTEDWVNQIINRRPNQLGEPDKKSDHERGTKAPNYNRLRQIPTGVGLGSNGAMGFGFKGASAAAEAMFAKCASDEPSVDDAMSLPDGIAALGPHVAAGFIHDLHTNHKLAAYVSEFYSLVDFYVPEVKVAAAKEDDVVIISGIGQAGSDQLSDEQKEKVIAGGTAVVDKRPELKKSKVYRTQVEQCLTNPTSGGLYDVLMSDGSVAEMLVFRVAGSDTVLVYEPGSGKQGLLATKAVFTLRQYEPAEFRKRLEEETSEASKVRKGDAVTFVSQTGECSLAFTIEDVTSGIDDTKTLKTRGKYYIPCSGSFDNQLAGSTWGDPIGRMNSAHTVWRYELPDVRIHDIIVSEAGGGQIRYLKDKLAVNNRKFRALVLNHYTEKKNDGWIGEDWDYGRDLTLDAGDFGDFNTVREVMEKVAYPVKLWDENGYIVVKDEEGAHTLGKVAALGYLMRKHGCSADSAEVMISESTRAPTTYRIKVAGQPMALPDAPDEASSGPMSSYHPTKFDVSVEEKAPSEDNRPFYQYHSPFSGGQDDGGGKNEDTMSTVQKATETGQKDVFDAGVLNSLVKSHAPADSIEKFLPTIVGGMDRLGRLLFLMHWHYEDFQDRFGDKEMVEMLDNIKSSFEDLGENVLALKKKTLAGDPDYFGLGLNANVEG